MYWAHDTGKIYGQHALPVQKFDFFISKYI